MSVEIILLPVESHCLHPFNCTQCEVGWTGERCDTCDAGRTGVHCDTCVRGWAEPSCASCQKNFGPEGKCNKCNHGWAGLSCDRCVDNFGPPGRCTTCDLGYNGTSCDICATNELQDGSYPLMPTKSFWNVMAFSGPNCTQFTGLYFFSLLIHFARKL